MVHIHSPRAIISCFPSRALRFLWVVSVTGELWPHKFPARRGILANISLEPDADRQRRTPVCARFYWGPARSPRWVPPSFFIWRGCGFLNRFWAGQLERWCSPRLLGRVARPVSSC